MLLHDGVAEPAPSGGYARASTMNRSHTQ